jgi:hypothetical protein
MILVLNVVAGLFIMLAGALIKLPIAVLLIVVAKAIVEPLPHTLILPGRCYARHLRLRLRDLDCELRHASMDREGRFMDSLGCSLFVNSMAQLGPDDEYRS